MGLRSTYAMHNLSQGGRHLWAHVIVRIDDAAGRIGFRCSVIIGADVCPDCQTTSLINKVRAIQRFLTPCFHPGLLFFDAPFGDEIITSRLAAKIDSNHRIVQSLESIVDRHRNPEMANRNLMEAVRGEAISNFG